MHKCCKIEVELIKSNAKLTRSCSGSTDWAPGFGRSVFVSHLGWACFLNEHACCNDFFQFFSMSPAFLPGCKCGEAGFFQINAVGSKFSHVGVGAKPDSAHNQCIILVGSVLGECGASQSDVMCSAKLLQQWVCTLCAVLHAGGGARL